MPTTWDGEPLPPLNLQKPARGSLLLARAEQAAKAATLERKEKAAAKKRDGRCRWPEKHTCLGGELEAAHVVDASRGGEMHRRNLVTLCPFLHRRGPQSVHGKQLKMEAETERLADGPLSFWRQTGECDALGQPTYYLVAREIAPFRLERD